MKTPLLTFFLALFSLTGFAQITTPITKANFGVDADLKARSLNGSLATGDDWYTHPTTSGTISNGTFVIDTTGAAAVVAGYNSDVSPFPKRMASLFRGMAKPAFTIVNNRLWLDALFIRDYHGNDSTTFTAGADKNGQNPGNWSGGIQGVPDKNDILDMFMHVRRSGPNTTDSLWFFGGLSLDNTTGNRYFDFELYQTDIYYDRPSAKWYGYGPDAGHTKWEFDAAGNITKPGDIIFSAEYQSSSLTNIEARIWIDRASLSITPSAFSWSGQFDGANTGSQYGYASILPKTVGAFYTGMQCGNNEWAGPFSLVLQDNSLATNYTAKQFMEFSVNLSKLGLDPSLLFGTDICGTPFNRIVVKTRASASFTAELKDFVAPTDLFLAPRAEALANVPLFCGTLNSVSNLSVINPSPSAVYTWSTIDGHIIGNPVSTSIMADSIGTYIVTQQLSAGCSVYARDTVLVVYDEECMTLEGGKLDFSTTLKSGLPNLHWTNVANNRVNYYEVQRSLDGKNFVTIARMENSNPGSGIASYSFVDKDAGENSKLYYRIKLVGQSTVFSKINSLDLNRQNNISMLPNPAVNSVQISLQSDKKEQMKLLIYNIAGELVHLRNYHLEQGLNTIRVDNINEWNAGVYMVQISSPTRNQWQKLVVR